VPPHVTLELVRMGKWTKKGNAASNMIVATTLPSLAGSL
jgi:hypothetical protein